MTKKIAIVGTHGTGKTSLSYLMAAHYKMQGKSVKIIQEVARSCPFPINDKMTKETAMWIYHEHCKKELEACRDHEVVISDRSYVDSLIYAEHFKLRLRGFSDDDIFVMGESYSQVIFVRPDNYIQDDGIRSTDKQFQQDIDKLFDIYMCGVKNIEIKSSVIFSGDSWKQYCL